MSARARAIGEEFIATEQATEAANAWNDPAKRVEGAILDCFEDDYEPSPEDVAMVLCEEDVAAGEYEGCSSELDLAASEYTALASRALGREN